MRYRSNNDWQCPITIRAPFGGGGTWWFISFSKYREHLCVYTGLTIVIPSSPYDAKGLLLSSIESNDQYYSLNIKHIAS